MSEQTPSDGSVSRRTMLKRIGIAGAVAWVTPVVTSINTPASAASAPNRSCDNPGTCASGFAVCGSDPIGPCYCFADPTGAGVCGSNAPCEGLSACVNGTCPPGFACGVETCCGTPVCIEICGVAGKFARHDGVDDQSVLRPAGRS